MSIPRQPNSRPGGGTFPVFSGTQAPVIRPIKAGPQDWMVNVQFDFSWSGFTAIQDGFGNNFVSFTVDFSSLVQNVVLPRFKSLFVSIDFDPSCTNLGPFTPLQIADNSNAQLIYVGCSDSASEYGAGTGGNAIKSAKATVCVPLLGQPGNVVMFSKRLDPGPALYLGAGSAIFTTWDVPPFRSVTQG